MNLKKPTREMSMSMLSCDNPSNPSSPSKENPPRLAALHSDIEDSGETSSDNDEKRLRILSEQNITGDLVNQNEGSPGLTPNRMLRMVDKFTNTKMFDKITDNAYVKRLMQDVANKDISLFVELQGLAGRLVLNIPPPPSDRLWYGFKGNPRLWLTAYPKFGDKELGLISNILQKIICTEFQVSVSLLPFIKEIESEEVHNSNNLACSYSFFQNTKSVNYNVILLIFCTRFGLKPLTLRSKVHRSIHYTTESVV
ncbi:testis-expressed protein 2-like isoform X2 [Diaphorina citri]|uniref:Testis-expressed protein 2-like isoform X2 n=1 Tax=Diaphorina citri TaxID=121845 RepID=A0A3Q0J2S1_DIACI|nr:testis-expressed protein 2-like isoform X2 [Diaphorina citri]